MVLLAALILASGFVLAIPLPTRARRAVLLLIGCALLALPLWLPHEARATRGLESILCLALSIKIYDVYVGAALGERAGVRPFFRFLLNPLPLVERRFAKMPPTPRMCAVRRLARGLIVASAGIALLFVTWNALARAPFAFEHAAKAIFTFVAICGVSDVISALVYLAGGRGPHFADNFFAAVTPAEFWRLYNRPVNQFFCENVYRCIAVGRSRPVLGVMIVFAVSGLLHEYLLVMATGRFFGYELAFFIVQGAAVAMSARLRPRTPLARSIAWAATILFMLASSTLFFGGANQIVPWYSRSAPDWLAPQQVVRGQRVTSP
jgi:hypothetical protein